MALTLWIYLAKKFLTVALLTMLILISFVYLIDALELLRKLSRTQEPALTAFYMALLKMPDMSLRLAPFAILLGTLLTFAKLTQNYELVAIRNTGLPARSFLLPAFMLCFGIGLFNLAVWQPIAATTLKKYERTHAELFPGSAKGIITEGGSLWLKQPETNRDTFLFASNIKENGRVMEQATVFTFDLDGTFIKRQDASRMFLNDGQWTLRRVYEITPDQNITYRPQLDINTSITPEVIQNSFNSPRTLTVFQLRDFQSTLSETGFNTIEHAMYYHTLLASPALMLAMFILAMPFALHFSRRHGLGWLVLTGLAFGFTFHLFGNMMNAYALTGRLPLIAAAWLPPLAAILLGLYFFLQFKEE